MIKRVNEVKISTYVSVNISKRLTSSYVNIGQWKSVKAKITWINKII